MVDNEEKEQEYVEVEALGAKEGEEKGKKCVHTTKKGKTCQAYRIEGSLFCFTHDPDRKQERALAVSQGGEAKAFKDNLRSFDIKKAGDVAISIVDILNQVRLQKLPPQIANSMFYGLNVLVKVFEVSVLEDKVAKYESLIEKKEGNR